MRRGPLSWGRTGPVATWIASRWITSRARGVSRVASGARSRIAALSAILWSIARPGSLIRLILGLPPILLLGAWPCTWRGASLARSCSWGARGPGTSGGQGPCRGHLTRWREKILEILVSIRHLRKLHQVPVQLPLVGGGLVVLAHALVLGDSLDQRAVLVQHLLDHNRVGRWSRVRLGPSWGAIGRVWGTSRRASSRVK